MTWRSAWWSVVVAVAGCLPSARAVPPPQPVQVVGQVAVVGSAPVDVRVSLRSQDGRSFFVEGPLATELGRLAGAEVAVWGEARGGVLRAQGYRLLRVDGQPVEVGVVERAPGGGVQLRRSDGSVLRLGGAADRLRPGQKVWVQGEMTLQVQRFGVIVP